MTDEAGPAVKALPCQCGHSKRVHLGAGRCDDARRSCMCVMFHPCDHPATQSRLVTYPVPRTQLVCSVCRHVIEQDMP